MDRQQRKIFLAGLRGRRLAKSWSRARLAQESGVKQIYIQFLEEGRRNNPSGEVLESLSTALECGVDDLISAA